MIDNPKHEHTHHQQPEKDSVELPPLKKVSLGTDYHGLETDPALAAKFLLRNKVIEDLQRKAGYIPSTAPTGEREFSEDESYERFVQESFFWLQEVIKPLEHYSEEQAVEEIKFREEKLSELFEQGILRLQTQIATYLQLFPYRTTIIPNDISRNDETVLSLLEWKKQLSEKGSTKKQDFNELKIDVTISFEELHSKLDHPVKDYIKQFRKIEMRLLIEIGRWFTLCHIFRRTLPQDKRLNEVRESTLRELELIEQAYDEKKMEIDEKAKLASPSNGHSVTDEFKNECKPRIQSLIVPTSMVKSSIEHNQKRYHKTLFAGKDLRILSLDSTDCSEFSFSNSMLEGMDLHSINFTSCDVRGANFNNSNLYRAYFYDAYIDNASFRGAQAEKASFVANFMDEDKPEPENVDFSNANLTGSYFTGRDFGKVVMSEANFSNASMPAVVIDTIVVDGANLTGMRTGPKSKQPEKQKRFKVTAGTTLPNGFVLQEEKQMTIEEIFAK